MKKQNESITFTKLELRIVNELEKLDFPNLQFLSSNEVLFNAQELLEKLLKIERRKFYELLEIPDENITFKIFEEFSKLDYFFWIIYHLDSVNSSKLTRSIIEKFQSKLMDFENEISFSVRFYEMHLICRQKSDLNSDEIRILDLAIKGFRINWINLSKYSQNRLKEINQKIADLQFKFDKNIVDSEADFKYYFSWIESIIEIPEDILDNAKIEAQKDWIDWYKFWFSDSDFIHIMEYCSDQKVRRFFYQEYNKVWTKRNFNNRPIIIKLLKLRQEQANLLWFNNFAELSLDTKMASSVKEILKQEDFITKKAKIKAKKELGELTSYFWIKKINNWDISYYSRLFKAQKYKIDERLLREYFEYNNVLEKLFLFAKELFNIDFKEIKIELYWDKVNVYEVYKWWKLIAYYLIDLCYNKNKNSWAWSSELRLRSENNWLIRLPIVVNVAWFSNSNWKTLLEYFQLSHIFHEFWHALHTILCEVNYSQLSWSTVEWDFIELPSQLMENWCKWEWLKRIAKHYITWDGLSQDVLDSLKVLKIFWTWIGVTRQNIKSKIDLFLHTQKIPSNTKELDEIIFNLVNKYWIFKIWKRFKPHANYWHMFWWSWEYAAGFYSYLRAEILEADIFLEFQKYWIFNKNISEKYYKTILSQGSRKPAIELFRDFMWREPNIEAFLIRQGF